MADICDFNLYVTGLNQDCEAFRDAILEDTTPILEDSCVLSEFTFEVKPESWGNVVSRERTLGIRSIDHRVITTTDVLTGREAQYGEIRLIGEANRCSPGGFVARACNKFRTLEFDLHGTVEHEDYEHWRAEEASLCEGRVRRLICVEARTTNQEDEIVRLKIGNQWILPRRIADESQFEEPWVWKMRGLEIERDQATSES